MRKIDFNKATLKIKGYVKENWGSPFIVGFVLLLLGAAGLLSVGSDLADSLAFGAYFTLVAGIFLQLVSFIRYRGRSNDEVSV
jgi:hypothetical protein